MDVKRAKEFIEENSKQRNDTTWYVPEGTYLTYLKKHHGINKENFKAMAEAENEFINGGLEFLADKTEAKIKEAKKAGNDPADVNCWLNLSGGGGNTRIKINAVSNSINPKTGAKIQKYGTVSILKRMKRCIKDETADKIHAQIEKAFK